MDAEKKRILSICGVTCPLLSNIHVDLRRGTEMRKSTERFSKLALSFERFASRRQQSASRVRFAFHLVRSELNRADHCFFRWRSRHSLIPIKRSGRRETFLVIHNRSFYLPPPRLYENFTICALSLMQNVAIASETIRSCIISLLQMYALPPKNRGKASVIQERRGIPSALAREATCISEMQYRIANVVGRLRLLPAPLKHA